MLGSFEAIGAAIVLVVSVAGALWGLIRGSGKAKAEIKALKDGAKAERQRNETDKRIAIERDALNRLRRDWTRK